ncbi:S8 family serine peptidase [Nocardioides panacihumi]|uniref:S8 family serine peptidase n=1 Tax=Nocardioides panacihumi TaxID=400774 RepID=A0ABP5D903_9ACTN
MIRHSRKATAALIGAAALAAATAITATAPVNAASTGADTSYLVLYRSGASTAGAAKAVAAAGGTVVATYAQIGVVIARSGRSDFVSAVTAANGVQAAAATRPYATSLGDGTQDGADSSAVVSTEPLSSLQWDMRNIQAPEAHQITPGSRDVLVADLDTGLDFTHPDLAPNYDAANSTDCTSGVPAPLLAGNDKNGHGTHTAGTIAAAANGIGIEGVAPNVRIAGVKTGNDDGFFFPEAVVCAFMWSATHGVDVTNNSYFADPWYMNCKNDPAQRAIWTAESRAIKFAQSQGTVVVAAEGNFSDDLNHLGQDAQSPDDTTPVTRDITNACASVPVDVPGVIGVSATGVLHLKSFYSSYGSSTVDVAAPGGDSILQVTPEATNGRVLSTYPAGLPCTRKVTQGAATYCYLQGTSMASPHVAGVAALVLSAHPGMSPRAVEAKIQQTATPLACPDAGLYAAFPSVNDGDPQVCRGGTGHNSFYGAGEVNALAAVQ